MNYFQLCSGIIVIKIKQTGKKKKNNNNKVSNLAIPTSFSKLDPDPDTGSGVALYPYDLLRFHIIVCAS